MNRPLTQSERIATSPGGFHRASNGRRNNPANRRAFDAWLEATRHEREAQEMDDSLAGLHIGEAVKAALVADGFTESHGEFRKHFADMAIAGQLCPDGARIVTLRIDDSGRWLERLDGWNVARDCDLREFAGRPRSAIAAVMQGARP